MRGLARIRQTESEDQLILGKLRWRRCRHRREVQVVANQAVQAALGYIGDLLKDEQIVPVGPEEFEIRADDVTREATISFSAPVAI